MHLFMFKTLKRKLTENVHPIMYFTDIKKNVIKTERSFNKLSLDYINLGVCVEDLERQCLSHNKSTSYNLIIFTIVFLLIAVLYQLNTLQIIFNYVLGVRCIVPNNYFVWEATRPLSDCNFCINVSSPIILSNISKHEFASYAFSSKPIVIKHAFLHWPARQVFSLQYFHNLYTSIEDAFKSVDEECQFLHFKSDFISIRDVLSMSKKRVQNEPGEKSWYVGWGNCHPLVLEEMHKHYPKPDFLPDDAEYPSKEYIFMGYDDGATMHLDFINRLMWQAQLQGSKTWFLLPPPECQHACKSLSFLVEPGDAVLIDTRVWYHATKIMAGEFSLSVQSEYG